MNIGLMAGIKNNGVSRGRKHAVEGDSKFHYPQVGPHMPPGFRHVLDQE